MTEENMNPNGAPAETAVPHAPKKNVLMGILAYLGPFVLVSYLTAKDDPFVKFHIKQGLVLLIIEIGLSVIASTLWMLMPLVGLVDIAILVLIVLGIINVVGEQEKELPLIGSFAKHFTF